MQKQGSSARHAPSNQLLVGPVYAINLDIKIIVDNIPASGYTGRCYGRYQ
jgi:hypothetical protein